MTPVGTAPRFPARYTHLDTARERWGDRVERLAPYFYRVDPLADDVVVAMESLPTGRGWALFEQALAHGIDTVDGAPEAYRALFASIDRAPPWVDWTTLDRGGELLMRAGVLGGIVLGAKSLVHGYTSPGGNKPLVFSGRLKEQAGRRLNETSRFVQAVCRTGGMRRFSDGFQITLKVRMMHAHVRRMILRSGRWDDARWGAPINQHDMAGTTLLFSLMVLDGLRTFGLKIDTDESESFMQLWRYVGQVIGTDGDLVPASEHEARSLAELMRDTQDPPDEDSKALVRALLESPKEAAKTPEEQRRAELQTRLGEGLVRCLVGDETADALGLPRTRWRHAMGVMRGATRAAELTREKVPSARRAFLAVGNRYWDRVIEIGLAGATAEFRPPERLAFAG